LPISLQDPTKEYYDFDDWIPSALIDTVGNKTVTATWVPIDYLIIANIVGDTFETNPNPGTFNVEDSFPITLQAPTGAGGKNFVGWFDAPVAGNPVTEITSSNLGSPVEIWAYFEDVEEEEPIE